MAVAREMAEVAPLLFEDLLLLRGARMFFDNDLEETFFFFLVVDENHCDVQLFRCFFVILMLNA